MARTMQPKTEDQNKLPETKPMSRETLEREVRKLSDIFATNKIQDFVELSSSAGEALFQLLPSDGTPDGVTLSAEQEAELKKIYGQLQIAPSVIDVENVGISGGTGSSTGYDIAGLRFENWKAVNRLLFEAEWYEISEERRKIQESRSW